jgi:hypothetical protein
MDLCSDNTSLSLSFTLRRKRTDDFQRIDIDLRNHSRSPRQRSLTPVKRIIAGKCRFDVWRRSRRSSAITALLPFWNVEVKEQTHRRCLDTHRIPEMFPFFFATYVFLISFNFSLAFYSRITVV